MFDMAKQLLFEDNHLIIVNKLPGQLVQPDPQGSDSLEQQIKVYLKEKFNKPGEAFLGVAHRIDRPVSGAVVFARTSKALVRLNEMLKRHELKKIYWAIVKNRPPQEQGLLTHYLRRNGKLNKSEICGMNARDAQLAELSYKIITRSDRYFLLEIDLHTGRHHQIRAQLSAMGCPIKGDVKYGDSRTLPDGSICLHARKVEFIHPVSKIKMSIIAPLPEGGFWKIFENTGIR
jgi:23S rRNA pseudouridine1911/1915/1917 synthase